MGVKDGDGTQNGVKRFVGEEMRDGSGGIGGKQMSRKIVDVMLHGGDDIIESRVCQSDDGD